MELHLQKHPAEWRMCLSRRVLRVLFELADELGNHLDSLRTFFIDQSDDYLRADLHVHRQGLQGFPSADSKEQLGLC